MAGGKRARRQGTTAPAESGACKKRWQGRLPIALVFPNTYHVGMSNLGMQLVYRYLNEAETIVCERVFLPAGAVMPRSVESGRPLADFAVIAFSIAFEQDFINAAAMLMAAGIEPLAGLRAASASIGRRPLVMAGGVAMAINPEPMAALADLIVVGDIVPVGRELVAALEELRGGGEMEAVLGSLAATGPGFYVTALYRPRYRADGRLIEVERRAGAPARVRAAVEESVSVSGHSAIISEETEFRSMHIVELGRGCSRGCRFCAAGFVYRPPRRWRPEAIIAAVDARPPGCERVGLLGMEMVAPEALEEVAAALMARQCALSFSSLRADILRHSPRLAELLAAGGVKSAAIAPDGASERLRRVINKGIDRADCLEAAEILVGAGVTRLKMYVMIGLPTEGDADLDELVDLVAAVQERINVIGRRRGHLPEILLSVNCFVPKAWTPFAFHPFTSPPVLKRRIALLRKRCKPFHNLRLIFDHPQSAHLQALLARGGRQVGELLPVLAAGGRNWRHLCKDHGLDPLVHTGRPRDEDEPFPWEIVDHGLDRDFLYHEYQRALAGRISPSCPFGTVPCRRCGVCHDPA